MCARGEFGIGAVVADLVHVQCKGCIGANESVGVPPTASKVACRDQNRAVQSSMSHAICTEQRWGSFFDAYSNPLMANVLGRYASHTHNNVPKIVGTPRDFQKRGMPASIQRSDNTALIFFIPSKPWSPNLN